MIEYKAKTEQLEKTIERGITNNYITDNSIKTVNQLNLPGFNNESLSEALENFPTLQLHNQKKVSHQVAKMVAYHAVQDNGTQNLYCADPNRLKFIFYNGNKWLEDMNREKTVKDVCKCILEKMGDPAKVIEDLGNVKKRELTEEHNGYDGPEDIRLLTEVLNYQTEVSSTIRQIKDCANDDSGRDNEFANDYLKKLAKLVRGDAEERNKARKLVK